MSASCCSMRPIPWIDPNLGQQAFGEFAAHWMETGTLRPGVRQLYDRQLRLRIIPTFRDVSVADITTRLVREWYSGLMKEAAERKRGVVSVDTSYRLLRGILTTAVDDGPIHRNPCRIRGAGAVRETKRPEITVDQLWSLSDAVPERYRALVWLASATAMRSGELAAPRRKDVDLRRREIRIDPKEGQYIEPGGGEEPYFGPPKTDAGARTIPIPETILGIVVLHMHDHA